MVEEVRHDTVGESPEADVATERIGEGPRWPTTGVVPAGRSPLRDALRQFRRNRIAIVGAIFIGVVILMAIFAAVITPYHYAHQNLNYTRAKPLTPYIVTFDRLPNCHWADTPLEPYCTVYLTGSDALGRDLWSRMVYGTRVSLSVALVASTISLVIGTLYGIISGYSGGWVDDLMMRIVDFLYGVPVLPIIIIMSVYFKTLSRQGISDGLLGQLVRLDRVLGGLLFLFIAIGGLLWIGMARLARGQVLSYKEKEFVMAARAIGASDTRIIFRHLLPNVFGPLLIAETLAIPGYIFLEAILSFIGLGVSPPTPSWGAMINEGYQGLRSNPHLVLVPGLALTLLTLAFNFLGDGLRDAFDPRLRGRQ